MKLGTTAAILVAGALAAGCMPTELSFSGNNGWPSADQQLSAAERQEIEARLSRLGYGPGTVDGVISVNTRNAIRGYQGDVGARATGYVSYALLNSLRANSAAIAPAPTPAAVVAPRRAAPKPAVVPVQAPAPTVAPAPTPVQQKRIYRRDDSESDSDSGGGDWG